MPRIELGTSSLPRKRSTTELHRLVIFLSGRPGSNRRHSAWKADALPTELLPHFSGESRIRTCEGKNQQIYSLSSLAAWVSPRNNYLKEQSRWRDSNPRPADYKSAALASWATSACTFFQKKARFKRIANVNIYFFNQNKLYFFLIRKSNKNQPLFRGWDFLKTFLISSIDLFV